MRRETAFMRALFVTPSDSSSGEAVTALHAAESVAAEGGRVGVLASPFTARFFAAGFAESTAVLGDGLEDNRRLWERCCADLRPEAVVFADYPLLFTGRLPPRLADDRWVGALGEVDAALLTFDHLGYAQRPRTLVFGPPHLVVHARTLPALPDRMLVLLPCPMHEPGPVAGRRGTPFRCWRPPLGLAPERRREVRRRWLDGPDDLLVFHAVPAWAWELAERLELPFYRFFTRVLEHHLGGLGRPVTVVSVNRGDLLPPSRHAWLTVRNLSGLPRDDYEELLFAADLMLTDNGISSTLGKAISAGVPCAVLRNSRRLGELAAGAAGPLGEVVQAMERERLGSVFPYQAFPAFGPAEVDELGLFQDNGASGAFETLEIFDGTATPRRLAALAADPEARRPLRARQRTYSARVAALPDAAAALAEVAAGARCAAR
jgi:hypothetical protein